MLHYSIFPCEQAPNCFLGHNIQLLEVDMVKTKTIKTNTDGTDVTDKTLT